MTLATRPESVSPACDDVPADSMCRCGEDLGHDGPHRCDGKVTGGRTGCQGVWEYDEEYGGLVVIVWPTGRPGNEPPMCPPLWRGWIE